MYILILFCKPRFKEILILSKIIDYFICSKYKQVYFINQIKKNLFPNNRAKIAPWRRVVYIYSCLERKLTPVLTRFSRTTLSAK